MSKLRNKITTEFKRESNWLSKAKQRRENRAWLEVSFAIALKVIRYLKLNKISQKELAETLGWSPQYLNKVLKGKENLTLETICKLQKATGLSLIEVPKATNQRKYEKPQKKKICNVVRIDSIAYNHTETFTGPKRSSHLEDSAVVVPIRKAV